MKSDIPLKEAYRIRARDLLPLTGDAGATVLSAQSVPLPQSKREVDFVMHLRRGGEEYCGTSSSRRGIAAVSRSASSATPRPSPYAAGCRC